MFYIFEKKIKDLQPYMNDLRIFRMAVQIFYEARRYEDVISIFEQQLVNKNDQNLPSFNLLCKSFYMLVNALVVILMLLLRSIFNEFLIFVVAVIVVERTHPKRSIK